MDKTAAALLSGSLGVTWFAGLAYFTFLYATGLFRVRRRLGPEPLGIFWTWAVLSYALREKPRSADSQRLVRGWVGALAMCALLVAAMLVIGFLSTRR